MSSRGMCAGNAVFYHAEVVSQSKIAREMRCFPIETAVGGCEGSRCETAAYARLGPDRCSIGKSSALKRWFPGGAGLPMVALCNAPAGVHGGAVLLGNVIAGGQRHCNGGFQVALRCLLGNGIAGLGMRLQVPKRIVMVGSRWCWVADGRAVLLGNAIAGFHGVGGRCYWGISLQLGGFQWCCVGDGGAVFLENATAGFYGVGGVIEESHCSWSNAL